MIDKKVKVEVKAINSENNEKVKREKTVTSDSD